VGIAVLGPLSVDGAPAELGRRDRVVLAALVVRPGQVLSAGQLAEVLWADEPPASWQKVIQGCVMRLRKVLGPGSIQTLPSGYRLSIAQDQIDAQRFELSVERARQLLNSGDDPSRAAFLLTEALGMWRGRALDDLDDWPPARIEAARLEELCREAEELYVEAALRTGNSDRVLAKAQTLTREQPLRERRWALLALAQYQAGQQHDALATLRRVRKVFNRDLGVDPGPELGRLEEAMLRQDPSLLEHPPLPEPSPVCPYRGLLPYDADDADTFFGRAGDVDACLRLLGAAGVLAVVGPSGSGKSSMVRAGVVAALRRDGRDVTVITPGPHPEEALMLLPRRRSGTTLVVDQFEETYTVCRDPAERQRFLDDLVEHAEKGPLVLVLRADHFGDVSAHRGLAGVVQRGLHLVSGMREDELRTAITEPARLAGLTVEPALVEVLVQEVSGSPGALPMLSHALQETWQRREGRTLTVAGYRASGGIREAVARSAEEVYAGVPAEQRPMLRALLLRLVTPGPKGDPVRGRVPRRLVVTNPADDDIIDVLVGSRLVTSDDGVVEIAHEALAREWPRLRGWLEEDVEGQRILHHLAVSADSWDALGRSDSELYRGARLAQAMDWRARTNPALSALEQDFLAAGEHLAQAELRIAQDQARQQRRVNRRLRGLLAVAAVLVLVATAVGTYAVRQRDKADEAARTATRAAEILQARQLGSRARLVPDISEALLWALEGVAMDDSAETRDDLQAVISRVPNLVRSAPSAQGYVDALQVSPDGTRIASPDDQGSIHLYDAASGRLLHSAHLEDAARDQLFMTDAFSPRDDYLAVGITDPLDRPHPVRLLDAHTLAPAGISLDLPRGDRRYANDLAFSADGRYLAVSLQRTPPGRQWSWFDPCLVAVWNLSDPHARPRTIHIHAGVQGVALSADGRTVYTAAPLTAYDVASGRVLWSDPRHSSFLTLDLSPDGRLLASEVHSDSHPGPIRVTDAATGDTLRILRGHAAALRDARFSDDGRTLASVSDDGRVIVWNPRSGHRLFTASTSSDLWTVDLSPDGRRLYTGGQDGMVRTWDLYGDQLLLPRIATVGSGTYVDVSASPDGRTWAFLESAEPRSEVTLLDTTTGAVVTSSVRGEVDLDFYTPGAWSPEGDRFAVANHAGDVVVLDARSGAQLVRRRVVRRGAEVWSMGYVDDGRRIAIGDSRHQLTFVDAETLRPSGQGFDIASDCCVVTTPDGRTGLFFEDSADGGTDTWRIMDIGSGRVLGEGEVGQRVVSAAFSPDGRHAAITGEGAELLALDVATGRLTRIPSTSDAKKGLWVRWSPDGARIVTGASDGTVRLWDAASLRLLSTAAVPGRRDVGVSPTFTGARQVTIASYDGNLYQWDTDPDRTVAFACQMAGRNLTPDEWAAALPDRPYEKTCPST
jgi:WD40 repeat protein/DNA-binding SARP family transcriptional activator